LISASSHTRLLTRFAILAVSHRAVHRGLRFVEQIKPNDITNFYGEFYRDLRDDFVGRLPMVKRTSGA
jgi:hypothetical protein